MPLLPKERRSKQSTATFLIHHRIKVSFLLKWQCLQQFVWPLFCSTETNGVPVGCFKVCTQLLQDYATLHICRPAEFYLHITSPLWPAIHKVVATDLYSGHFLSAIQHMMMVTDCHWLSFWPSPGHQQRYIISIQQYLFHVCLLNAISCCLILCDVLKNLHGHVSPHSSAIIQH